MKVHDSGSYVSQGSELPFCSLCLRWTICSSRAAPLGILIHWFLLSQSQTSQLHPLTCRGFVLPSSFIFSHSKGENQLVDLLYHSTNVALPPVAYTLLVPV